MAHDDLTLGTTSVVLAGAKPAEECSPQLQAGLSNQFSGSLDELTTAIDTALDQLSIPKVGNYF